jgi:hypothetical protein
MSLTSVTFRREYNGQKHSFTANTTFCEVDCCSKNIIVAKTSGVAGTLLRPLVPVGVAQQPQQEFSNSYSVKIRKVEGRVTFDQKFAGKTKMVKVYNLSGKLVCSKAVIKNTINLQKDFCLPVNVYVVEVNTVR